jgi:UDP-N-acetylglucosamine--N-acetylmuramyl-(pentapeptide) pyrophosphoryl-undecaprenol N-acetylglucosamine transferase
MRHLLADWQIVHQSGAADVEATRELYRKFALDAEVEAFWPNMPSMLAASSLAICRAGGTTLAELAAAGTPALLLPYPHAADDHQRKNAELYVAQGAAQMLDERELIGRFDDQLAEMLVQLLSDANCRMLLSQGMRRLARPRAAGHVASLVWSLITSQAHGKRKLATA